MMLRSCPSHLFGHGCSLSNPHFQNKLSSLAWDFTKYISISATTPWSPKFTFRGQIPQSNFTAPLAGNEDSHHSNGKWLRSPKNGLVVGGDELNRLAGHDRGVDPLHWESKEDKKQSIHMNSKLLDRSLSVSRNAENHSTLELGPNGLALNYTERECSPSHPAETEYTINGNGSNRNGVNPRSCGADLGSTDVYYQKMLEVNPGNSLLLTNYAKFLHEVQHDVEKAEKFYKIALVVSPGDGEILSMYAKFIWETHNDAAGAELYFQKAVEVAPEDCYVAASYAHFLWNSQDDEEEEEEENEPSMTNLTSFSSGTTAG